MKTLHFNDPPCGSLVENAGIKNEMLHQEYRSFPMISEFSDGVPLLILVFSNNIGVFWWYNVHNIRVIWQNIVPWFSSFLTVVRGGMNCPCVALLEFSNIKNEILHEEYLSFPPISEFSHGVPLPISVFSNNIGAFQWYNVPNIGVFHQNIGPWSSSFLTVGGDVLCCTVRVFQH